MVRFGHKLRKVGYQPHKHTISAYGKMVQYEKEEDKTPGLDKEEKIIQQV